MQTGGFWCILRTSGAKTLPLAKSLAEAGFDVWTPRKVQVRRRPRSNSTIEREMPIAPTFVFVRSSAIPALNAIKALPVSPHPSFSLFAFAGRIPLIADSEVTGFRDEEERASLAERRTKRKSLVMGQRVHMSDGAFAGMSGVVIEPGSKFAVVAFDGEMRMKIATWLISEDNVQSGSALTGCAA